MTDFRQSALEGRMPVLPDERIFTRPGPFLASCTVFGAAIWVFMLGAGLSALGDVRFTIPGMLVGAVIGYLLVMVGAGLPCFRYGIDGIDVAKSSFGQRGAVLPLLAMLGVSLSWSAVVIAFIARGGVTIVQNSTAAPPPAELGPALALAAVALTAVFVLRGPHFMERVNNIVGPGLILMAAILLILLGQRIGWENVWTDRVPVTGWMFEDRGLAFLSAFELGLGGSLGCWPFIGGLTRLVKRRKDLVSPSLAGVVLLGPGFGAGVAALVANAMPSSDPVMWLIDLAGPVAGAIAAAALLIGNIAAAGLLIYFSAVAAQQIPFIRRMPWWLLTLLLLSPAAVAAFNIDIVLSAVLGVCNYQSFLFVGVTGITFVSYKIIHREKLDLRAIFAAPGDGPYGSRGGINWNAVIALAAGTVVYRLLYDPMTLAPGAGFDIIGASLPGFLTSALLFYGLERLRAGQPPRPVTSHPTL